MSAFISLMYSRCFRSCYERSSRSVTRQSYPPIPSVINFHYYVRGGPRGTFLLSSLISTAPFNCCLHHICDGQTWLGKAKLHFKYFLFVYPVPVDLDPLQVGHQNDSVFLHFFILHFTEHSSCSFAIWKTNDIKCQKCLLCHWHTYNG